MSDEEQMVQLCRTFFHKRRQKPSVVRTASQTLLSRMMRTREGENFFFSQAGFSRQTIKRAEQPVQFALGGKKILINFLGLLVGKPLDFINHCVCLHVENLRAKTNKAKLKLFLHFHPAGLDFSAMASEKIASTSARDTEPTRRFSFGLFTTGTLRISLCSTMGSASSRRWPGVRHFGTGRIKS